MELFLPSLGLILLAVALAYFIMPSIAAPTLITGSVLMLVLALYMHYRQFGRNEYEQSTWQYNLRQYSSYVMIGAILLGAYGFYAMNNQGDGGMMPAAMTSPSLPTLQTPVIGGGMGVVMKTASSRISELMRRGRISLE
jgi:hypothetical protein